jgi:pimeloyl-ACP methyl ester carboxylesterase
MEKHLMKFLRTSGYDDTTDYGHVYPARRIADDLAEAARVGRPIAVIGFSQGGFQAVEVARELSKQGVEVPLLVTIAAGGLGRWVPTRWGADPRELPANVTRCLNVYAEGDRLGTDGSLGRNRVWSPKQGQLIENVEIPGSEGVSHIDLVRCYPESRVHPVVKARCLDRVLNHLDAITP